VTGRATQDWDASTYDRISAPQQRWAAEQLERLTLQGDEVVLDAGCGSGKIALKLAELVPDGRVYAVDAAPSMVAHTSEALGDRATVLCQDLVELALPEPVDVVFSNATFHWIPDHDALFAALARNMKPGARLVAQCGGRGNIDRLRTLADEIASEPRWAPYFERWTGVWNYAGAEETAERLQRAGFTDIHTWLQERPTELPARDGRTFVASVCLIRHLDRIPAERRDAFVDELLARYGEPVLLEYVRLNMTATRGRN
jgi:trans-aconitate 2-methyltransferase